MTSQHSLRAEVTVQQAADLLGVSLPFMDRLFEEGAVICHGIGLQRRVPFTDLMVYKAADDRRRREAADLLGALGQELGI